MKWSLYLGKISGIKLYVHWTFILLIGWILFVHFQMGQSLYQGLWGVVFILAIFVCVTLHELGHALTAQRFQIVTRQITLLPIGGLAQMEKMPDKAGQELWVALAGPLVNIVIAVGLGIVLQIQGNVPTQINMAQIGPDNFWVNLWAANWILALFNLIPAFPMDGGRVLRAILSFKLQRIQATAIAASVGQFLAIVFIFLGLMYNVWLAFIGFFIFLGAGSEAAVEKTRSVLSHFRVDDVLMRKFTTLSPDAPLSLAVEKLLDSQETEFLVGDSKGIVGILTRKEIISGLSQEGKNVSIKRVMTSEFPRIEVGQRLDRVYEEIGKSQTTLFPVYSGRDLVGVIDMENISELLMIQGVVSPHGEA